MKYAFVQDINGVLLSPTKESKAWYLIRKGKAKLLQKDPLVIQLQREQLNTDTSKIKLGIDPGDTTGIALVQECTLDKLTNKAILKAEIRHRLDISKKLTVRAEYRRARRNEKRYRPIRFNNRASSRRLGRLAPSIKYKKDEILRVVNKLFKLVVISGIYCEDVSFDIRALTDDFKPYSWQYQVSNKLDNNIRKAVILRDNCTCRLCGASNTMLEVHHITPKRQGGSNTLCNLITLCSYCHSVVTGNEDSYKTQFYKLINGRSVQLSNAMHVMQGKKYLYNNLAKIISGDVILCTGGDTANKRQDWGIEKTHSNDAVCITGVECQTSNIDIYVYTIKPQRKKIQTKQDTSSLSIKHRDLVWYTPRGKSPIKCSVIAILQSGSCSGKYKLKSLDGQRFGPVSASSLRLISSGNNSLLFI